MSDLNKCHIQLETRLGFNDDNDERRCCVTRGELHRDADNRDYEFETAPRRAHQRRQSVIILLHSHRVQFFATNKHNFVEEEITLEKKNKTRSARTARHPRKVLAVGKKKKTTAGHIGKS